MLQFIYIVIQSWRSYNTLELKIAEKLSVLKNYTGHWKVTTFTLLDSNLYKLSKVESMKSVEFVVQKMLYNLLSITSLNAELAIIWWQLWRLMS